MYPKPFPHLDAKIHLLPLKNLDRNVLFPYFAGPFPSQGSSVVEQGTHKPLVGSSNLPPGTSPFKSRPSRPCGTKRALFFRNLKKRLARERNPGEKFALAAQERWLSGRKQRFAKASYPKKGTGGSNPPLSASTGSTPTVCEQERCKELVQIVILIFRLVSFSRFGKLPAWCQHPDPIVFKVSKTAGDPLDELHLAMKAFGSSVVFRQSPHAGDRFSRKSRAHHLE